MKSSRNELWYIKALAAALMLIFTGCRDSFMAKKDVIIPVTGDWEIVENLSYSDETDRIFEMVFTFSGTESSGGVSLRRGSGGVFSGGYTVSGDNISFTYIWGRAFYWSESFFNGVLNRQTGIMTGQVRGRTFIIGQGTVLSWEGIFTGKKPEGAPGHWNPVDVGMGRDEKKYPD